MRRLASLLVSDVAAHAQRYSAAHKDEFILLLSRLRVREGLLRSPEGAHVLSILCVDMFGKESTFCHGIQVQKVHLLVSRADAQGFNVPAM